MHTTIGLLLALVFEAAATPAPPIKPSYVACWCFDGFEHLYVNQSGVVNRPTGKYLQRKSNQFPDSYLNVHQFIIGDPTGYLNATDAQKVAQDTNSLSDPLSPLYNPGKAPSCSGYKRRNHYVHTFSDENTTLAGVCRDDYAVDSTIFFREYEHYSTFLRYRVEVNETDMKTGSGNATGCFVFTEDNHPCTKLRSAPVGGGIGPAKGYYQPQDYDPPGGEGGGGGAGAGAGAAEQILFPPPI